MPTVMGVVAVMTAYHPHGRVEQEDPADDAGRDHRGLGPHVVVGEGGVRLDGQ
jgi:hypothetical protein